MVEEVQIFENTDEGTTENISNDIKEEDIIVGEIIDNNWFLSAIKGDINYLKNNAKNNAGKIGENNCTALMYCANGGHTDCVRFLVNNCKDELKKQDANGNTALIYAAKAGYADIVKILVVLEGGIKNNDGKSAYYYAKENNDEKCMKILQDTISEENKEEKEKQNNTKLDNKKLKTKLEQMQKASEEMERELENAKSASTGRGI